MGLLGLIVGVGRGLLGLIVESGAGFKNGLPSCKTVLIAIFAGLKASFKLV